jgi:hypothetical protein
MAGRKLTLALAKDALLTKLSRRNRHLIRACNIVNQDPDVREIENEFDALQDEIV